MITWFDPPVAAGEVPARMPSPWAADGPHPLARRAAAALLAEVGDACAGDGKMLGVLVVRAPDGRVGWLRGFSGMLGGRWFVDGWAPPLFDPDARAAFWPAGEAELAAIAAELAAVEAQLAPVVAARDALVARYAAELEAMRARHRARREARRAARAADGDAHALDQESRGDGAERRRLDDAHAAALAPVAAAVAALEAAREAIAARRAARSRGLWDRVLDGYALVGAGGARRALRDLFAPEVPPGGAGDCAAPKLLVLAHRLGLAPLALAEVWCGAPPATGDRRHGRFYPPCRGKCGPILPFLLDGVDVEPAPVFGAAPDAEARVVFEDAWIVVVDKPVGLLSVPGRHARLRDSVQARLGAVSLVHRLDLDTSGLLLAARDRDTHAALQRAFARRAVDKRYVAWLDGAVAGDAGTIDLPLRVDLDDRPRQIVDAVHGRAAVTEWRVLARDGARTRVALFPRTGRTHQLRVHAAHPRGLGAPIAGDRLYGEPGPRLLLHAEALAFVHPRTGARVELVSPAPF